MHAALVYLTVRSIRNSVVVRLRRLRQPRYLFIAVAGVLYLAAMLLNRRHVGTVIAIPPGSEGTARLGAAAFIAATMSLMWVLPQSPALRFTVSDVQFLFPAPLSRRELLAYKMVRLALSAMALAGFMTLVMGPVRLGPGLLFCAKFAVIAVVIVLHEAGVSLYRLNARNRGGLTGRRRAAVFATGAALALAVIWVLTRFAFASAASEFLLLTPLVAIALAAQVAWVLRSDAAFEEEAAIVAEKTLAARARVQRAQPTIARARPAPLRLSPRGPAETAILWKNWLLLDRASGRRWLALGSIVFAIVVGIEAFGFGKGNRAGGALGFGLAAIAVVLGPVFLRVDLRQDLAHLVVIKTWPVPGAAIVRGEVLAPAIALSAAAAAGILVGALFAPDKMILSGGDVAGRVGFFVAATVAACAAVVAQLVIQNGIAAMYPAWIRITPGATQPGGIEMMGQILVVMYGGLLALLLAALPPAVGAAAIRFATGEWLAPAAVFAVLLSIESYAATELIGRVLDRTDLQDVALAD